MLKITAICPVQDFEVAVEGSSSDDRLTYGNLTWNNISLAVQCDLVGCYAPLKWSFSLAPNVRKAGATGTDELEISVRGAIAALVHVTVVVTLPGPCIWVDVGDSVLRPVVDSNLPISVSLAHLIVSEDMNLRNKTVS